MNDVLEPEIKSVEDFLKGYEILRLGTREPPTLLQIARFPNWENVYSNILAFFLDSQQVHGFGTLFIRSILTLYTESCPKSWFPNRIDLCAEHSTELVEREQSTTKGGRIDIFVECSDILICVENKIWSRLHNQLLDYRKYCEDQPDKKPVLGIVLSPNKLQAEDEEEKLNESRFINITYAELVDSVRKSMGSYIGPENTRYQFLLLDFLEQSLRLTRSDMLDEEQRRFLKIWRKNESKINNIQAMCDRLTNDVLKAKEMADTHSEGCLVRLAEIGIDIFTARTYLRRAAVFDLVDGGAIDDCVVFLDVWIEPLRISHVIGRRRGRDVHFLLERINAMTLDEITFSWDKERRILVFVNRGDPFDESTQEKAVDFSVDILKALAKIRQEPDCH